MKRSYKSLEYEKEVESLKNLTAEEAALKAIKDAGISLEEETPEDIYKIIHDRLNNSKSIIN